LDQATTSAGETLARLARFGRVHFLDTVTSTNDYAFGLASRREPAVVVAQVQTKGRGRFQREWFGDDSSLLATYLLFADGTDSPPPAALTHLAGLALCTSIDETTGLKTQLRWPNDVMFGERKLAGILCEARGKVVAVGLGLNVNQAAFPPELLDAGSLRMATGREWDKLRLLEEFLVRLFELMNTATKQGLSTVLAALKERSAVLHRRVEVQTLLRKQVGTVVDLDGEGRLVLRTDSGKVAVVSAGQVRRLR
jgi:BirA family biotin operon repressor/biotin-[acetyl-CoA-carboxylase] ligase